MVRAIPSALKTTVSSGGFKLATLFHIELTDGTTFTLTDWDTDLQTDLMGSPTNTYTASEVIMHSDITTNINSPIDDCEMSVILASDNFVADDVRRGKFDAGTVTIGFVDPDDLANPWLYAYFDIGNTTIEGLELKFELLGPERRLEKDIGRVLTANCPWAFGDIKCGVQIRADAWTANTAFAVGDIRKRATGTGIYWFQCTTAGTSGGSEPTWPSTLGGTVSDGSVSGDTVVWTAIYARRLTGTVSAVTDRKTFDATGISVVSDFFGEGFLTWQTGDNAGDTHKIKSDDGAGAIGLHVGTFDTIQVGDTFDIIGGCRLRITEDCKTKWNNVVNHGGFPFLTDENVTMSANKG